MRIAIFGTGGVGGYFGGRLAQAGETVTFIARGAHLAAMRERGLRVESVAGDFVVHPADAVAIEHAEPVDVVLVAVKAWQVSEAARSLAPLLGPDTFVVPLQNGVEAADRIADAIGAERVVGGLCRILAHLAGPGVVCHSGVAPRVEIGERDGRRSPRVQALAEVFGRVQGLSVLVPDSIEVAVWEKFLFIAPLSAVGAVTRLPVGAFRSVPSTRRMLEAAMREVEAVARARGVALPTDAVARTLAYVDVLPDDATTSMQRDILEGRPSELEDQVGATVRLAAAAGIAAPVHTSLYAWLQPHEIAARNRGA
jgi:2-dehydropantoate 2-reductase